MNINTYNKSQLQDPSYLAKLFSSAGQFAMYMTVKYGNLAMYMGAEVRETFNVYLEVKALKKFQRTSRNILNRVRSNAVSRRSLSLSLPIFDSQHFVDLTSAICFCFAS